MPSIDAPEAKQPAIERQALIAEKIVVTDPPKILDEQFGLSEIT